MDPQRKQQLTKNLKKRINVAITGGSKCKENDEVIIKIFGLILII